MGRSRRGKPQGVEGGVYCEMQGTVQETEFGEQCRSLGACTRRRGYPKIQGEYGVNLKLGLFERRIILG